MASAALASLQWKSYAANTVDLIAPVVVDLTTYTDVTVTPSGPGIGTISAVLDASGVVIDNMSGTGDVTVTVGPVSTLVPRYQKATLPLFKGSPPVVFTGVSSVPPTAYFYTGTFRGIGNDLNAYKSNVAANVASITGGTVDAYLQTLRWKFNYQLSNGFNLDNLTDSGFYDVLNPTSPASGDLSAGTWQVTQNTYSSSNAFILQAARNILGAATLVYERRLINGVWTKWRNVGTRPNGQCQFGYVDTKTCRLSPTGGGQLLVNGNTELVPAGGVTFPNTIGATTLADGTLYYAYVYMDASGVMQPEFSTTAFALDATGNPIKSGDPTRTLVGMVNTVTGGTFIDSTSFRYVATYFNRFARNVGIGQDGGGTGSTSAVAAIIGGCLSWGADAIVAALTGYSTNGTGGSINFQSVGIGGNNGRAAAINVPANSNVPVACANVQRAAIGVVSLLGYIWVSGGTGTWYHTLNAETVQ